MARGGRTAARRFRFGAALAIDAHADPRGAPGPKKRGSSKQVDG
jgi:hypothetical protein